MTVRKDLAIALGLIVIVAVAFAVARYQRAAREDRIRAELTANYQAVDRAWRDLDAKTVKRMFDGFYVDSENGRTLTRDQLEHAVDQGMASRKSSFTRPEINETTIEGFRFLENDRVEVSCTKHQEMWFRKDGAEHHYDRTRKGGEVWRQTEDGWKIVSSNFKTTRHFYDEKPAEDEPASRR